MTTAAVRLRLAAVCCAGLAAAGPALAGEREGDPGREAAKLAARSVWALVPDAPAKADLRPGLVRGSAVAVAPGVLLAGCGTLGGREEVGLVRHAKHRRAAVAAADPGGDVCVLRAADAPLSPMALRGGEAGPGVGEPLYAIAARDDGVRFDVVEGRVTAAVAGADAALVASLDLPAGALSAVVVDGAGSLVGLAAADPAAPGSATVRPVAAALAAARVPRPPLSLRLTTQRGPAPVLRAEEPLELTLAAAGGDDAFAYCFYADADGRVSRVFPNRFAPDARLPAGGAVAITGPEARFEIVPERPGTREAVACFASRGEPVAGLPAAAAGPDLEPLPGASLEALAREFRDAGGGSGFAEARLAVDVAAAPVPPAPSPAPTASTAVEDVSDGFVPWQGGIRRKGGGRRVGGGGGGRGR